MQEAFARIKSEEFAKIGIIPRQPPVIAGRWDTLRIVEKKEHVSVYGPSPMVSEYIQVWMQSAPPTAKRIITWVAETERTTHVLLQYK